MKKLSIVCTLAVLLAIGIAYTAAQSMSDFPPGGSSSVSTPSTSYQQALPWSCQSNADCPDLNSYCRKRVGYCDAGGSCRVRPSFCPEVYNPVCGCNGVTYTNSCFAAVAGVSVRNVGACGQPQCCDPYGEPGQFGNPICIEGHTCCADGDWRCNDGSGQPTCNSNSVGVGAGEDAATSQSQAFPATLVASDPGNVCDQCCDAADEPGINGNPICFEGATCCAGGKWQCNNGAGHSTCDVDGIACLNCCDPLDEPGVNDNPLCIEGHTCCSDGLWQCNDAGANSTCVLDGAVCTGQCCDPFEEPGQHGNPLCVEGHTCCFTGKWECNDAGTQSVCDIDGLICETCCNPHEEPGVNGSPFCFEGASCCATGDWQCNDAGANSTCGLDGIACADCCDPSTRPDVGSDTPCLDGFECCSDGSWACNTASGRSTCDLDGQVCDCCDSYEQPGHYGNPICFEGATCCGNGEWACNDAGGQSTCDSVGETCGQVCGGIAGIPCPDGEFCKTDFGECCCDFLGTCTFVPQACPDDIAPVCGCDGVTYQNECFADAAGASVDHPGPCVGACCLDDGSCLDGQTQSYCEQLLGGVFQGTGSVCSNLTCPVETGACCLPDGTCIETNQTDCLAQCGSYEGDGTTCGPDIGVGGTVDPGPDPAVQCPVLPTGSCCLPDDSCVETHGQCECESLGGTYNGDGSTCATTFCPDECNVEKFKSLMIIHPDVVDDPVRTTCTAVDPASCGPWTFGSIAAAVAGTTDHQTLSDYVLTFLRTFNVPQTINTFDTLLRDDMETAIIQPWITASGGEPVDFSIAPFRLLAIVNRPDLRNDDPGAEAVKAGEGRFVFGVLPGGNFTSSFTVIFEFKLPGDSCGDVKNWQIQWAGLSNFADHGPAYRDALQAVTDQFATVGADPTSPNGSALAQFRTNEILLGSPWELREFRLLCPGDSTCPSGGEGQCTDTGIALTPTTVEQTPDLDDLNGSQLLTDYMLEFSAEIQAGDYRVPCSYQTAPFRGASSPVELPWDPLPGQGVPQATRDAFALNTCSGCHLHETGAAFQHIQERLVGDPSDLTIFLQNDLDARLDDVCNNILLAPCGGGGITADQAPMQTVPADRAGRVH